MARSKALREQLERWGYATVTRFASNDDGPSAGDSVLHRTRDLAPGTKENVARQLVGRSGRSRRAFMAQRVQELGVTVAIVPIWACDPVPARNDADRPHVRRAVIDLGIPDDLRWIERAVASLERQQPLRARILREEYCGAGTQETKAARVRHQYGGELTVRQYRAELAKALEWMDAKRAA